MEIRVECVARMEDSDSPSSPREDRPASPCDSEISVGCEGEVRDEQPSPMDMTTTHAETSTEDDEEETEPHSPSTSRGAPSPTLSSGSLHTESFTYLSDDEYFRPLKRLAMSGTSPPPHHHAAPQASPLREAEPEPSSPPSPHHPQEPQPEQDEPQVVVGRADAAAAALEQKQAAGLRSFSILDILSYKPSRRKSSVPVKIVRPWDTREEGGPAEGAPKTSQSEKKSGSNDKGSALDALFKMTNKTLDNLNKDDKAGESHCHSPSDRPLGCLRTQRKHSRGRYSLNNVRDKGRTLVSPNVKATKKYTKPEEIIYKQCHKTKRKKEPKHRSFFSLHFPSVLSPTISKHKGNRQSRETPLHPRKMSRAS
ncbi:proteoglycan 4-like [Penaeus japonicus]|uniref:proteoglycan 4-like n=1 Tax=Penaeus japonicus TaxID=27405 RepID=UPI001C71482E|nr:proteoglycan 4-like [Penaeus japonicus]